MKKTIIVTPDSLQFKAIDALMKEIKYEEVERFITGGLHSAIQYVITYQGRDIDYNENSFVFFESNGSGNSFGHYFSLSLPDGYFTNDINIFIEEISKSKKTVLVQKIPQPTFP